MLISALLLYPLSLSSIWATALTLREYEKRNNEDVLGATYFITNRDAQTIIISAIHSNGSLSFAKEFPTGGKGGFAVFGSEVDVLFSQDSLLVSDDVSPLSTRYSHSESNRRCCLS